MAAYTQSKSTLLTHAAVTHPDSVEGTSVVMATYLNAVIVCWHALVEATANTNPGTFRVFGSLDAADDENWFHILDIDASNATAATEAMTATEPAGETVLAVASTTGFAAKDNIYVQDTGTLGDSEWHTVDKIVANTSIDIMMGLTNQKDSSDVIWGSAQQFTVPLPGNLSRVRVDFSHEGAVGANCHIKAEILINTAIA